MTLTRRSEEMDALSVTTTQDIEVTPEQMAVLFWSMGSDEQITFFNKLADIAHRHDFEMQMLYITEPGILSPPERLTKDAVRILETIRDVMSGEQ